MDSVGANYNSSEVSQIFVLVVDAILNGTDNIIKVLGISETGNNVRNVRVRVEASATVSLQVSYTVTVLNTVYSEAAITSAMNSSVSSGDFTLALQFVAKERNVTSLLGATSSSVNIGNLYIWYFRWHIGRTLPLMFRIVCSAVLTPPSFAPTSAPAPNHSPTNSPSAVSPGGIAGIVIGCVVFVALVIAGVYYYMNGYKFTPTSEASTINLASQSFVDVNPAKLEDSNAPEKVEGVAPTEPTTAVVEESASVVVF